MKTRKVLLLICDGWGIGDGSPGDVISSTDTPYWDSLLAQYPHSRLSASAEDVGLPAGQMGNSEVGHLNIGAGRVVYQDLMKINKACQDGSLRQNPALREALAYAKSQDKAVHFMGLLSDGGVHSSLQHLYKLIDVTWDFGIPHSYVHCFMDGRDTDPRSGISFVTQLQAHIEGKGCDIASLVGRYYAMDRDQRWERIKEAYDLLVTGKGTHVKDVQAAIQASYDEGITDEFIRPLVCVQGGKPLATIQPGDVVIFFNFRNDRAKELSIALTQRDLYSEGMQTLADLHFCTLTPYDAAFIGLHVLFDKENVEQTLADCLAKAEKKQLHIAETEKYAHVTFFFNGGREEPFPGEDRILVPSPKVATYDLKPQMSAPEVTSQLVSAIRKGLYHFIVCNYANGDMVGHTGVYSAIQQAVRTIDQCLCDTVEAAKECGYEVLIIADHGNADYALNPDGSPNTAHSLNPVPLVYIFEDRPHEPRVEDGILADVAPTILSLLGLPQPSAMTGHPVVSFAELTAQLK
ncbi:MAG: 2,3-bisphosphoglycerate-independent phosphoglycerate mutase [Tannerellaceae bacterium]|jgi:2,3-bisphosphoglycerate-independent phosphoglycerate mutase|nr:2,3-bisphosphoglycerate-independent phosphoglycerate mutase [Tannerellaceae bacterium]